MTRRRIIASVVAVVIAASAFLFAGCGGDVNVRVHVDCPTTCVEVETDNVDVPPRPVAKR